MNPSSNTATPTTENKSTKELNIQIVSDTVCPWCYVGKRRLDKALAKLSPDVKVKVTWLPFFLNPDAPKPSKNKLEMYKKKFGPARVEQMVPHMIEVGREEGIAFSFGGNTGNTLDSHRLIEYALKKFGPEKQNEVVQKLFSYYFEQEKDIVDVGTLIAGGKECGLDSAELEKFFGSSEMIEEVKENVHKNQERQITGVPFFIINNQFAISGAQSPQVFENVFKKAGVA